MPAKKPSKNTESELTEKLDDTKDIATKTTKPKKKLVENEKPVESEKAEESELKVSKTKKKPVELENAEVKVTKSKKKTTEPEKSEVEVQVEKPESKVVKSKKKTSELENVEVKITKSSEVVDKVMESVTTEPETVPSKSDPETIIKEQLENTKLSWVKIIDEIHKINLERDRLEIEKNKIVKTLKDLMDKLQSNDSDSKGFMIDNKVQLVNTKHNKEIIPVDSDSEDDSDDEDESSDSEDNKQILLPNKNSKNNKSKVLVKTTKGNAKNLKLSKEDSMSDSD